MGAKNRQINPAVILFLGAALVMSVVTVYTGYLINSFSTLFTESIEERLLATVRSAARICSAEELSRLREPEDMSTRLYSDIRWRITKFAGEHHIKYVYYYYIRDDGALQPIADNDLTEEAYTLQTEALAMEPKIGEAIQKRIAVT
ncbi:MAG: hybrid sensor histidine kinase/response regulator, partial [Treponema sp.]|nr:hybrid sensor histidine kinase/response regulator [Treponema sp.]